MIEIKYKLTIVRRFNDSDVNEEEICKIGYFKTERELQQWTEDNLGEIERE